MLEIKNISTYYGHIQALRDASLVINSGEIVSLVGANGAGKTTLLNSITGIVPPREGEIFFNGQNITHTQAEGIVGLGISHVPERRQVFGDLTVYDNLVLGAYLRLRQGDKKGVNQDIAHVFELFPILNERQKQAAGTLSGGEQQMLAIGRGLMAQPSVLLLDEPSLGLAPILVQEIFNVLKTLREAGKTILLVEQNARAALQISDRGYVLETGSVVMEGSAAALIADEGIQKAYLGGKAYKRTGTALVESMNEQ